MFALSGYVSINSNLNSFLKGRLYGQAKGNWADLGAAG